MDTNKRDGDFASWSRCSTATIAFTSEWSDRRWRIILLEAGGWRPDKAWRYAMPGSPTNWGLERGSGHSPETFWNCMSRYLHYGMFLDFTALAILHVNIIHTSQKVRIISSRKSKEGVAPRFDGTAMVQIKLCFDFRSWFTVARLKTVSTEFLFSCWSGMNHYVAGRCRHRRHHRFIWISPQRTVSTEIKNKNKQNKNDFKLSTWNFTHVLCKTVR